MRGAALAFLGLAGCGSAASVAPVAMAPVGPTAVMLGDAGYHVRLDGEMVVSSDLGAMGNDQGLTAKQVAQAFCAGQGRQLDTRALGRFQAGAWVFDGGCA